jgi:HEPN domain-containing protein
MTLSKEWIDKAKSEKEKYETSDVGFRTGYEQGATAYKQAVEKLLKDNLAQINKDLKNVKMRGDIIGINGEKTAVEILLTELQTLKPTSND